MITKQIAGLLYSYGYDLVREGTGQILSIKGVYEVGDTLKMDLHYNGKHWASEPVSKIGKEFFILAREMDLTKPIEGVGVPIIELAKIAYSDVVNENTEFVIGDNVPNSVSIISPEHMDIWMCLSDANEFCTLEGQVQNQLKMFNWLYTHHFNLDFPEGTTTNLI